MRHFSIDKRYIRVQVSKENGGFVVNTVNGDTLKKSDNNKKLLFHTGEYDTSFVSFRITEADGTQKDYIFGGKYGDSGDPSHRGVIVTQETENSDIVAHGLLQAIPLRRPSPWQMKVPTSTVWFPFR